MARTVADFRQDLLRHGLVAPGVLSAHEREHPPPPDSADAEEYARRLMTAGLLTKYQAAAVYQGRAAELLLGDYVLRSRIGSGGMGDVYRALDPLMNRDVAIKVLPSERSSNSGAQARFRREIEAAARVRHDNVVAAYHAGTARGVAFLVMEYVVGETLEELVVRTGPLSLERALDCVRQAATGLAAVHAAGMVHRDVKPANLLLDATGVVKVLDLGLVRFTEATSHGQTALTVDENLMGTPDFLAPEQADDGRIADERSDVYSLGCTLWYLLTARPPYTGDSLYRRIVAHREQPTPSLAGVRGDIPDDVDRLMQSMLAKRPEDRCAGMPELLDALDRFARGESLAGMIPAPPPEEETPLADVPLATFLESLGGETPHAPRKSGSRSRADSGSRRDHTDRLGWGLLAGSLLACGLLAWFTFDNVRADPEEAAVAGGLEPQSPAATDPAPPDAPAPAFPTEVDTERDARSAAAALLTHGATLTLKGAASPVVDASELPSEGPVLIERVDIEIVAGEEDVVEQVSRLRGVQFLSLRGSGVDDAAVAELRSLAELYHLTLTDTRVTGRTLAELRFITGLRTVTLIGGPLDADGVAAIGSLTQLKYVWFEDVGLTARDLAPLRSLPVLRKVTLIDAPSVGDEAGELLAGCDALAEVSVARLPITGRFLELLADHPSLESVTIDGCPDVDAAARAFRSARPECKLVVR